MPTETKPAEEVQAQILHRVEQDLEFRTRLIADPKGVIEAEAGVILPDEVVVIIEEAVVDAQQSVSSVDAPLTQDELAQVTGGYWGRPGDRYVGCVGDWNCENS